MKKLNRNRIQYQLVVTVLFLTQFVQAQPAFDDGDDVQMYLLIIGYYRCLF
jgi:hypothetical protein